ncbi:peptide/nickel transport system substrate-binding protein [Spinactinospora alkalitolerans]|uniref:Peptide/nickel transport system substrate-binding protein n=1 Tax=Spinactinospora alkalitolerans TaxID=687207 RepID=A0A852U5K9_9ACTN|nr:ABC transporter substrate-binding protein [Spinactinospora alkalitolerans]NYE50865.1 peptide/nickel transport system substrate-binding protein [Spinactinospora alkalitolerans]
MSDTRGQGPGHAGPPRRSVLLGGLGALGAAFLATGCSQQGGAATAISSTAATGTPAPGGLLRIARPPASQAETLDPASSLSAYEYLGALYSRLVRVGPDGEVAPDLATEWDSSPDGTTWTFRLREDVTFHDGRPFSSADAAYTVRRLVDPEVASPQAGVLGPLLDPGSVEAPDERTLVIELSSPNFEFPSLLTGYNCYVIPEGSGGSIGRGGVGTGPFRLESFAPAGRGRLTAFPEHWEGRPVLDAIEFYSVADVQARTNALLAGQVDLLSQTNLDFATARVISASSRATIARSTNAQWYVLPMLCTQEPFTDPRVRQAMKLAYDPTAVLKTALQGTGVEGHDNPVPPNDPSWTDYSVDRDPERARALLKEAGREDLRIDLHTSSYDPVFTPMALAYKESAAEAGITVDVRTASADSYYTRIWMKKPLCATYWYTGRPVDQMLNQIFRSGSSYNETAWSDEGFDALLDDARRTRDTGRRRTLYQDAQRHIVDNGGAMTPMFADRLVGISRDVLNYRETGFEFDYLNIGLRAQS